MVKLDKNYNPLLVDFAINFDSTTNPNLKKIDSLSAKFLAKSINFKVQKVRQILKEIKSCDYIRFEANINTLKLHSHKGSLEIRSNHPKDNSNLTSLLAEVPFVRGVHELVGEDISHMVSFLIPSIEYLPIWIEKCIINKFSDKIYSLSANVSYEIVGPLKESNTPIKLDNTDLHLIGLLLINALMTLRELSIETGLSLTAIHKRLNRLKREGLIEGYTCYIDWNKINLKNSSTSFICKLKADYRFIDKVSSVLSLLPFIKSYRTIDKTDFLLFTSVKNLLEYRLLTKKLVDIQGVLSVRTYFITQSIGRSKTILDFYNYYSKNEKLNII